MIVLWIFLTVLALYLAVTLAIAVLACRRFTGGHDPMRGLTHATDELLSPYKDMIREGRRWLEEHPSEEASVTSHDGLTLRASLYENPDARAVLVACHGYRSNGVRDFASACGFYHDHDMTILLVDQRAAGRSDGKYITFGVRESEDAAAWCRWARERFPDLPIVLAGISMGASTVLMAADRLPDGVSALLADCGYDSPWEEFAAVARKHMSAAALCLLPGVGLWCRALCGFGLRERSASESLKKCQLPVFFVHGEADGLVPFENAAKMRAACPGPTGLFTVPGAEHGMSYLVDREGYHRAVDAFLRAYVLG